MGQRKERPVKPTLEDSIDSSNNRFVRALGFTDRPSSYCGPCFGPVSGPSQIPSPV